MLFLAATLDEDAGVSARVFRLPKTEDSRESPTLPFEASIRAISAVDNGGGNAARNL